MKKIYIVRKFVLIEGGARHYYEEECFNDYDRALKYFTSFPVIEKQHYKDEWGWGHVSLNSIIGDEEEGENFEDYIIAKIKLLEKKGLISNYQNLMTKFEEFVKEQKLQKIEVLFNQKYIKKREYEKRKKEILGL